MSTIVKLKSFGKYQKYVGKEINGLEILELTGGIQRNNKRGVFTVIPYFSYRCRCGNVERTNVYNILSGHTKGCGCGFNAKQNLHKRILARASTAKKRCEDPNNNRYKYYGERGIKFKFESPAHMRDYLIDNFKEEIESISNWQIDRTDCDGHYEPGNIRIATPTQQIHNRRGKYKRNDFDDT